MYSIIISCNVILDLFIIVFKKLSTTYNKPIELHEVFIRH